MTSDRVNRIVSAVLEDQISPFNAKKDVAIRLKKSGITDFALSAKTTGFSGFGYGDVVFVTIHKAELPVSWNDIFDDVPKPSKGGYVVDVATDCLLVMPDGTKFKPMFSSVKTIAKKCESAFPMNQYEKIVGFDNAMTEFVAYCQSMITKYETENFPNLPVKSRLTTVEGGHYVKVIKNDTGRSAWAFIDKTTGGVLKPATWNAPAKWERANIFKKDTWRSVDPYGPAYLR